MHKPMAPDLRISDFNVEFELNSLPSFLSSCPLPTFVLPPSSSWITSSPSSALLSPLWSNSAARYLTSPSKSAKGTVEEQLELELEGRSVSLLRSLVARLLLEEAVAAQTQKEGDGRGISAATRETSSSSSQGRKGVGGTVVNKLPVELVYSLGRAFHPILTFLTPPPTLDPATKPPPTSYPPSQLIVLQLFPVPGPSEVASVIPPSPSSSSQSPPSKNPLVEVVEGYPTPSWSGSPTLGSDVAPSSSNFAFPDPDDDSRPTKTINAEEGNQGGGGKDLLARTPTTSPLRSPDIKPIEEVVELEEKKREKSSISTTELMETFRFEETSLGPRENWPQSLVTAVAIVQASINQACLWWGEDFTMIYNDAYAEMSYGRHPALFGAAGRVGWSEAWSEIEPLARQVISGEVVSRDDNLFFLRRDDLKEEERYFSWSFIPVRVEDGSNGGLLNHCFETTSKVLAERRLNVLRELASSCLRATSQQTFSQAVTTSLSHSPHDVPFTLLYSFDDTSQTRRPSNPSSKNPPSLSDINLSLVGSVGVPSHHPSAPSSLTLTVDLASGTFKDGTSSCPWPISEAMSSRDPVFVSDCSSLVEGFETRSWGETESALVIPLFGHDDSASGKQAILIVGLNSRRPFDENYNKWLRLLRLQLASGLSSVISLESQLQRAEELAKLDRAKTAFFSNISHELRTPLTLIQGPVLDLLSEETREQPKQMLQLVSRNVNRLATLVNSLMDSSRAEAGRIEGSFSPHQLGALTADLASLFRSAVEKARIVYTVDCDVADSRMVYVDPSLWETIVFNIIGNAFKYCLKGSIRVFLKYRESEVEFGVQDTGVGIPRDDIFKVVERFHRVESVGRSHEGTGIGLSLTSDLIKLHGGTLSIDSTTAEESVDASHGSTFVVRIPLGSSHLPPSRIKPSSDGNPASTPNRSYSEGILEEVSSWSGTKDQLQHSSPNASARIDPGVLFWSRDDTILVVDDNLDMRRYLSSILSPYCTVILAENGQVGFEMACEHRPNLIVSDMMMPILDGAALLSSLRATKSEVSLIPLLLITARAGEEDKVNGLLLGAEDYLSKPFSSRELVARCHLQMQMGKRRIDLEKRFTERTLEIKMRAEEAEERRKEAEEQRRRQELLVDVTSHEIRNPVSAILQNGGLCKDNLTVLHALLVEAFESGSGFFPSLSIIQELVEDLESLDAIIAMGQSQERIANDILSLARIQLHTLEIFPVEMNIVVEAKRIINVFASECKIKDIALGLTFGQSLLEFYRAGMSHLKVDSVRLGQILINLLSNAIKFTTTAPVRNIHMSIDIRRELPLDDSCLPPPLDARPFTSSPSGEEEYVYIYASISDSGPGLTPGELSRLFQRFQQASAETHSVFGGHGLGLYVCRQISQLMDGKIEVVSQSGEGSTFRFYVRASLVTNAKYSSQENLVLVEETKSEEGNASKKVLIVEDNLINQKVLKRQLAKAGFLPDVASDGREALASVRTAEEKGARYLVILMDIEMPVMDGLAASRKIREMEAKGELAVRQTIYALTGNARPAQVEHALESGVDDVILKPYKINDIFSRLSKLRG
ncbi:hypothetical protein BDY24DRAFT_187567 [Mrakia frigida]|uniref:uncharacterized protein n=1 Tax=Mrakia frigida TaxID=29902 RepID=UPI003FCC0B71